MIGLRNAILTAAALSVFLTPLAAAAEPQVELQRNPFQRPNVEALTAGATSLNEGLATDRDPGLRAVLVAGSKSMVNIDGVILQLGECTDAYCLVSVEEGKALISKNKEKIALSLYDKDNSEER